VSIEIEDLGFKGSAKVRDANTKSDAGIVKSSLIADLRIHQSKVFVLSQN